VDLRRFCFWVSVFVGMAVTVPIVFPLLVVTATLFLSIVLARLSVPMTVFSLMVRVSTRVWAVLPGSVHRTWCTVSMRLMVAV